MSGRVSTLSCVLLLAAPTLVCAGPLNKKLVGRDATWVIHVDVEAAAASSIGKLIAEDADAKAGIRELREQCGVDLIKDVKGITIWGVEGEDDHVAVIHTTAAVDDLEEKFRDDECLEEVEEDGYTLLKWTDGDESHYAHIRKTRAGDERIVFIAGRTRDLIRGLEVADGDKPSAASDGTLIKDKPGENSIVFLSVPEIGVLIPGEAREHIPAVFGKISGLRFEAGERGDELFAEGAVLAATSEDAAMVQQAALGAIAMCRLACQDDELKDVMKFADALKISAKERTVTFSMRCNTADVRTVIEQAMEHERKAKVDVAAEEDDEAGGDDEPAVAAPEKPRKKKGG